MTHFEDPGGTSLQLLAQVKFARVSQGSQALLQLMAGAYNGL